MSHRKRTRITSLIALVTVLVFGFATVAHAIGIALSCDVTPSEPNMYHVGDTITYRSWALNNNDEAVHAEIYFLYPDYTEPALDTTNPWAANEERTYYTTWVVTGTEDSGYAAASGFVISSWFEYKNVYLLSNPSEWGFGGVEQLSTVLIPGISVNTVVDADGDGIFSDYEIGFVGSDAIWQSVVTNEGNCPITVTLSDSLGHAYGDSFVLELGESSSPIQYTQILDGDTSNTVTATGVDALGGE